MAVAKGTLSISGLSCPPKHPTLHVAGSACLEFQNLYVCKIEEEICEEEKEKEKTFVKEIGTTIHLCVSTEIQCHELSWIHGGGGGGGDM